MASNRAPKHDFAPAWLKIPDTDCHKSSGPKQAEHGDRPGWGRPPPRGPLPHEDYYGDRRGFNPTAKTRHHSIDDDYYSYQYGYYGGNGYNQGWGAANGNFRSPPSHNGRDCPPPGKFGGGPRYPPPLPPGPPMNGFRGPPPHPHPPPMGNGYGGYEPPYYGGNKDYYDQPPYYNHHANNRPPSAAGRRLPHGNTATNGRADKENKQASSTATDSKKKKEPNLEEEFPSLIGDCDPAIPETKTAKTLNSSSGVWEKSPISKIKSPSTSSNKGRTSAVDNPRESVKHNTSNIYKSLIPNKSSLVKKSSTSSKDHRDVNSNTSHFSKATKESRIMSPTVDILSRSKPQPKKLPDKKSDFLKQLKKDKQMVNGDLKSNEENGEKSVVVASSDDVEHIVNGVSALHMVAQQNGQHNGAVDEDEDSRSRHSSTSSNIFSATSLEAEQRLLKEMGWTEDEEEYVITEDDKKQTEKNIEMLRKQQREARGSNGFVHAAVTGPRCFSSPQHHGVPIFHTPPPLNDDDLLSTSSSSSESGDEDDSRGC